MGNLNIHKEYVDVLKKCRFVSKADVWYVEGSEATLDLCENGDLCMWPEYSDGNANKFNDVCGLFDGWTNETYEGYNGELPRYDGESCSFDEFLIYDEFGNEISDLTLSEYKVLISK